MVNGEILLLSTGWKTDYWEKMKKTHYIRGFADSVIHLKQQIQMPLPWIGACPKYRDRDLSLQLSSQCRRSGRRRLITSFPKKAQDGKKIFIRGFEELRQFTPLTFWIKVLKGYEKWQK